MVTGKDADLIVSSRDNVLSYSHALPSSCAVAPRLRALLALLLVLACVTPAAAQIELPQPDPRQPIAVSADAAWRWQEGAYEVWYLRGNCSITQGVSSARSAEAMLWVEHGRPGQNVPTKVIAYLEQGVECKFYPPPGEAGEPLMNLSDKSWFGRFHSFEPPQMNLPSPGSEPQEKPAVYHRGRSQFDPHWQAPVQQVQFVEEPLDPTVPDPVPLGTRRIRVFPRSDVPVQAQWFPSPGGEQWVAVVTSGVNLIVDGLEGVGTIDVSTDRMVMWVAGIQPDLSGQSLQRDDLPLEIYLEGNIVFRQGERVIYAQRMYYDVRNQVGIVLDAEMLTPVPNYAGMLRLKSRVLRQLDASRFVGNDAMVTSSRLGEPTYNLSSGEIFLEDKQMPVIDPLTGAPQIDPATGEPAYEQERMLYSSGNVLYLGRVPVLYWPTMATNLEDPTYYIKSFALRNDNLFGTQVSLGLDAYQVFGIRNPPPGTDWQIDLDYMSKRGPAAGTTFEYDSLGFLGIDGPATGIFDAWGIHDRGTDNLGGIRSNLPPPDEWRGRILAAHRQELANNYTLTAELGLVSDRNFLEQYFENEWDTRRDQLTGFQLKQIYDNQAWALSANARLNDFFTENQWLPKLEHFWLGESLWGNRLTWFEHTEIGYASLRAAEAPTNPAEAALFTRLPWEANVSGERIVTRQEIDMPFQMGPVSVVPYALGELAHWGESLDGHDAQRAYGQAGIRASIPFWTVNPHVENQLFDVHGLSHKVVFDAELSYADASRSMTDLPLYDEGALDDNSTQEFRRRIAILNFGGVTPMRFDERYYALRTGLGGHVTSPVTEIADDLTAFRLGMRHRWQTKRGHPANRQIIDWIVFDTSATLFPKEEQNFGETIGLIDYGFRWHAGDRLTFLSTGIFDLYPDGFKEFTVGGFLTRPPRGNLYLGFRGLRGPIDSSVLQLSYNYHMSPKWISSFGTSVDLDDTGNIGQNFWLTRVGESLLVRLGFNVDANKDVFGVSFLIEPRFLPTTRTGTALGAQIPPAGAFGLE